MASHNSPVAQLEPVPATKTPYKPRKTLKPPAIQSAILAKRANGQSKAKIARDLEVAINTVTNVLELNDFDRSLESEQKESLSLIPAARKAVAYRLALNDGNIGVKVLENTIWPLNAKTSKTPNVGLTLAIQKLMGNVEVNAPGTNQPVIEPQTTTNGSLPESTVASTSEETPK